MIRLAYSIPKFEGFSNHPVSRVYKETCKILSFLLGKYVVLKANICLQHFYKLSSKYFVLPIR